MLRINREEVVRRRERLLEEAARAGCRGVCLFGAVEVFYFSGFSFLPTERPVVLVVTPEPRSVLLVPRLEEEHAARDSCADEVRSYPEYPGRRHPMEFLRDILGDLQLSGGCLLADADGYASSMGYRGPRLSEVAAGEVKVVAEVGACMRMVKSPAEISLIRESVRWGNLAHAFLQQLVAPGRSEAEISWEASARATDAMLKALGPHGVSWGMGEPGAGAGFRGQVGEASALPHALTTGVILRRGDVLVTGAGANVGGYHSELERTMFVGEPEARARRMFELMLGAQQVAMEAIRPGARCADVDEAVGSFFADNDLEDRWRHHTGHALGILGHEAPFFDVGDDTVIAPGMVFSVEPGIYVPGLGGFRHSDTVLVTDRGIEVLTYYPRDLESLVCGV
ncbi:MAG: Xaa-Pro peptidase family protein [Bacillota bacterium]|nr:Xaa-Pro peptidase family protein [Bacillota bacterium]